MSQSLPISSSFEIKGEVVKHYFDNLLPDNEKMRSRLGVRFKTKSVDAFDLLEAVGRECVGAVQLLPKDMMLTNWNRISCEPLSDEQITEILQATPSDAIPDGMHDDDLFRILVWDAMLQLAERVNGALITIEKRLPKDFPVRTWESISVGMQEAAAKFLAEASDASRS